MDFDNLLAYRKAMANAHPVSQPSVADPAGSSGPAHGAGSAPPVELRNAVRFPLRIPLRLLTAKGEVGAVTENISATGVAFLADGPLDVQMVVRFTLNMPAEVMGTPQDVVVHCAGRVVRCTPGAECSRAAAVIDEYYFSQ